MNLGRVTTVYVDVEDRFRLSGAAEDGSVVVLWLTQRLLCRLVPPMVQWLDKHSTLQASSSRPVATAVQAVHSFAQQSAVAGLRPQMPVHATAARHDWLVQKVDVVTSAQALCLTFRPPDEGGAGDEKASVTMDATHLRQWLGIVHGQWQQAGWPQGVWPLWMAQAAADTPASGGGVVWH